MPASSGEPPVGSAVHSLVWVDDFHVFLTRHVRNGGMSGAPGEVPDIHLPEASPSRAYLKIEEAFLRWKPQLRPGLEVLEVGCAPGGATTAMLDRGLKVVGIDPQRMDPRVDGRAGFRLIRKQARRVSAEDLRGADPEYLVMDMGIAPLEALDELAHVVSLLRARRDRLLRLSKGFLTIKLNDRDFASFIPLYLDRLVRIGFRQLSPRQLAYNRQEFFVMARGFE